MHEKDCSDMQLGAFLSAHPDATFREIVDAFPSLRERTSDHVHLRVFRVREREGALKWK